LVYFAERCIDSDDASMNKIKRLAQRFQKVGTIEIRVYSETAGREGGNTEAKFKDFLKDDVAEIPEKALKGDTKSHGTAYVSLPFFAIEYQWPRMKRHC
jgi:hypothetical protein